MWAFQTKNQKSFNKESRTINHNHYPTSSDKELTQLYLINVKALLLMTAFSDKHDIEPKFDPEIPYKVFNETVHKIVETPNFTGVVLHNVYYDSGVNPDADTGPSQTLVLAGVRGENIVNFTSKGFNGRELSGPSAEDIIAAMDASLDALNPNEEK
jgi:hypothetical protein